jgi:acyl-CoA dehydrogenase
MIDFTLDSKLQDIVDRYREFTSRVIVPVRMKYDELAEFPWEVVKAAYGEGLMNGQVPVQYGGNGYNLVESTLASIELGYGCIGIGICIDANTLALTPLILAGNEEQKKKFFGLIVEKKGVAAYCLTEPNAGSDVANIKSTAIQHGDKFILNGHKRFITNAEVAEFFTVFALTNPEKGARSLTAFIVPADLPGIEVKPRLQKMGQKASVQNEIIFKDVEVPAFNKLGEEGHGFLIAMKTFDRTRTGVAGLSVGCARAAYDTSRDWAKNRIQFGAPVTALQGVSFMLADMATQVEAAYLLTMRACQSYDFGEKESSKLSAMSKMFASDVAMRVTTDAVQVMAGDGYSRDFGVEKMMRDAKLCQIYEGTNQVQRVVISKSILK